MEKKRPNSACEDVMSVQAQGTYDIIIIGAGSAGCTLAYRLAMGGFRILVLEAGMRFRKGSLRSFLTKRPGSLAIMYEYPSLLPMLDWGTTTIPQKAVNQRCMAMTRGLGVGGSSNINGMICIRGYRADYDSWEEAGNTGWGYDNILPYLCKMERSGREACQNRGSLGMIPIMEQKDNSSPAVDAFLQASCDLTKLPILEDLNINEPEGFSHYDLTCHKAQRQNTAITFMKEALATKCVTLLDQSHVYRLECDDKKRIRSVLFNHKNKKMRAYASYEVIVSAGAMGSPQVLMLSGIGPSKHLIEKGIHPVVDSPGVGQNFQDHPSVHIRWRAKNTKRKATPLFYIAGMLRASVMKSGWYAKSFLEAGGFVRSQPSKPFPDLQVYFVPWGYTEPNNDDPRAMTISREQSFTTIISLVSPKSVGEIRLHSNNPYQQPAVDPAFLKDSSDLKALRDGLILFRKIAEHSSMKEYFLEEAFPGKKIKEDKELDDYVRRSCRTIYHPTGSCKMGSKSDKMAVVDARLRVNGVRGLRVVDASIMPSTIHGNTNIPTIMIAEKASDMILEDHKKSIN